MSKVLERLILKFIAFFTSTQLQFGFKPEFSTTLCTGMVENIISHYINKGSCVFGCFLDASKAFNMVNHAFLVSKLVDRGLPLPVVCFLLCWYCSQQTKVQGVHASLNDRAVFSRLSYLLCTWMVYC